MPTKVLVVDDDVLITDILEKTLTAYEFEVQTANSGSEAIQAAHEWDPDLIVLDLMMPDLDGWQVCREVRTFSQAPILVLSAVVDSEGVMRALDEGADNYLVKPAPAGVLVSHLRNMMQRSGEQQNQADAEGAD